MIALFVALTQTGLASRTVALVQAGCNCANSSDIVNNSLTSVDIKNGSLLKKDFKRARSRRSPWLAWNGRRQRRARGLLGQQGRAARQARKVLKALKARQVLGSSPGGRGPGRDDHRAVGNQPCECNPFARDILRFSSTGRGPRAILGTFLAVETTISSARSQLRHAAEEHRDTRIAPSSRIRACMSRLFNEANISYSESQIRRIGSTLG